MKATRNNRNNPHIVLLCCVFIIIIFNACGDIKYKTAKEYDQYDKEIRTIDIDLEGNVNVYPCVVTSTELIYYEKQVINSGNEEELMRQFYLYDLLENRSQKMEGDYGHPNILDDNTILWVGNDLVVTLTDKLGDVICNLDMHDCIAGLNEYSVIWPKICVDDAFIYLNVDYNNLVILNRELELMNTVPANQDLFFFQNGKNVLLSVDYCCYEADSATGNLQKHNGYDDNLLMGISAAEKIPASNYDCYLYSRAKSAMYNIYEHYFCGLKKGRIYEIFSYEQMGIDHLDICAISEDDADGFWICTKTSGMNNFEIVHLKRADEEKDHSIKNDKQILLLGTVQETGLERAVSLFNKKSDSIYIEIKNYQAEYGDYQEAVRHMNLDMMSGEYCDLYSLCNINADDYVEKGIFLELSDYFEHRKNAQSDDFTPEFYSIARNQEGNIYILFTSYILTGVSSKETIDYNNWENVENMINPNMVFNGSDSLSILGQFLRYSGNRYIDLDNRVCKADDMAFRSLLEMLKRQEDMNVPFMDSKNKYALGEAVAVNVEILYPIWDLYYEELLGEGYQVTMPGHEGFVVDSMSSSFAICSKSTKLNEIYQFIDFLYSEPVYSSIFGYEGVPVTESGWEYWKNVLTREHFYDALGNEMDAHDVSLGINESMRIIRTGTYDIEKYNKLRKKLAEASYIHPMPDKYLVIILEEVRLYFEGKKSIDDTLRIINNKVNQALQE